jgi:hypothetical protein
MVGQRDALRVPPEEPRAERRLERLNLLAERRLLDAQARRGARHVARLGDGDEVAEVTKIHILKIST